MKSQRINKVITVHPEGNMNVWTTFHHNPSNSCWDILVLSQSGRPTDQPSNRQIEHTPNFHFWCKSFLASLRFWGTNNTNTHSSVQHNKVKLQKCLEMNETKTHIFNQMCSLHVTCYPLGGFSGIIFPYITCFLNNTKASVLSIQTLIISV